MPELPDVEAYRGRLAVEAVGREIADVEVTDAEALRGASPEKLARAATGHAFSKAVRHGKVLFARLGDGPWLALHFGMTGNLVLLGAGRDTPEHARTLFVFDDGDRLAFVNPRKFGWLELTGDIEGYLEENDIGPDALALSEQDLEDIIGGTRGQVKPALMDQSKLAGIGNVYSDEILFCARLRPDVKGNALSDTQLRALYDAMRDVLEMAADRLSDGEDLPRSWLARHREDDATCPRCSGDVAKQTTAGRSARFCPACQQGADD